MPPTHATQAQIYSVDTVTYRKEFSFAYDQKGEKDWHRGSKARAHPSTTQVEKNTIILGDLFQDSFLSTKKTEIRTNRLHRI